MAFGTGPINETKPFTTITVRSPVQIMPLNRARLAPGTYRFQGDLRRQFGHVRERRLISSGVVLVEYNDPTGVKPAAAQSVVALPQVSAIHPEGPDMKSPMPERPNLGRLDSDTVAPFPEDLYPCVPVTEPEAAVVMDTPTAPIDPAPKEPRSGKQAELIAQTADNALHSLAVQEAAEAVKEAVLAPAPDFDEVVDSLEAMQSFSPDLDVSENISSVPPSDIVVPKRRKRRQQVR